MHFLDIVERSHTGEAVSKEDFDLDHICLPVRELLDEYDLEWTRDKIIVSDEAELRRFYEAGRALLLASGVYNQSTGRVIRFTEAEIDDAAAAMKKSITLGEGSDAATLVARKPEDSRRPLVVAGNPGCPMKEDEFKASVRAWAAEPGIDLLTCGSLIEVDGFRVRHGEASELLAVRRELTLLNEIAAEAGRPGIGRLAAESAVSDIGDLASTAAGLLRPSDAHLVALNNELLTNRDNINRAANGLNGRAHNASLACVMVEGLAGSAAGAAIVMIASLLASNVLYAADYHLCHPIHLRHIATSTRECLFVESVTCQVFGLFAPAVIVCDIYPRSGAGTKELLYEVAANALVASVSGGHVEGVGSADGLVPNCSGLEVRLMGDVARGAVGMTRAEAAAILPALLERYEPIMDKGNVGRHLFDVHDIETNRPRDWWQAMYDEVAAELRQLGVRFA